MLSIFNIVVIGDFNEILFLDEKWGEKRINIQKSYLKNFVDDLGALDIAANGPKFT